jgi:DNA replication protein DnaC
VVAYKEKEEQQERPKKRFKIRDARENTKVEASKCVDLNVGVGGGALTILTPAISRTVRYYGRTGTEDLFKKIADPRVNEENFNVEFIGAPGTGKSNLVWAVAEYLGTSKGLNVVWVSRRVST